MGKHQSIEQIHVGQVGAEVIMDEFIIPENGHFSMRMCPNENHAGNAQNLIAVIVNGNEELPFGQVTSFSIELFGDLAGEETFSEIHYTVQCPNGRSFSGIATPKTLDDQLAAIQPIVREGGFLVEGVRLTNVSQ